MPDAALLGLTAIIVLGISAQFIAARLRLPSILLLLLFGILAGPVAGLVRPEALFGDLLFPFVSLSVALILYEGGLSLSVRDLPRVGGVVRNLLLIGAPLTGILTALTAHVLFGLGAGLAALLGAVLMVTGPTVIGPMLRVMRPEGALSPILMWEGIAIDPVGAVAAVLVFEALAGGQGSVGHLLVGVSTTAAVGGALGLIAAGVLVLLLHRYWIPDYLQSAVSLMLVVALFTGANYLRHEAGLLAVTIMGVALANQKLVDVKHIVEFKENLRVLLISSLFILLAARLRIEDLRSMGLTTLVFVGVLILVVRPLAVWTATLRCGLDWRERAVLAWMAPRGIVAAAVASVFALRLEQSGYAGAHVLVPLTFAVIIGTVAIYGLTAPLLARKLGVADSDPQGVLVLGAQPWARAIAAAVQEQGLRVLVVDSNRANVAAARMEGLPAWAGSILAEYAIAEMPLGGLGRFLALTPNDWINTLAAQRLAPVFGSAACYQLPPHGEPKTRREGHRHMQGRWLFREDATYAELARRFATGAIVKTTPLTEEFDYDAFRDMHGEHALVLFIKTGAGRLEVVTAEDPPEPAPGDAVISLLNEPAPTKS